MTTSNHIVSILGRLPFRDVQTMCLPPIHSTKGLTSSGFGRRGAYGPSAPRDVPAESHAPASQHGRIGTLPEWFCAKTVSCVV